MLDGDITPRKLDPFASSLKTMRWNLIECTDPYPERRATKRVGYVWAEFRAVDEGGEERFFTCGLGLEATRSADGIKDRWYFTTTQRVGIDLTLARLIGGADDSHAGALAAQPAVKADLAAQLEQDGALHDGPTAYKEALRGQLLPFATPDLYEQMLEVIRQLRKPKLSDTLNVKGLSTMLSAALPAVDVVLVRKLGDALEQLHELQRQYDELKAARTEVASLVSGEARAYARGLLAVRGERLRASNSAYERARTALREADAAYADAGAALQTAEDEARRLHARYHHVDEEHLALIGSKAYKAVARLEECTREQEAAQQRAVRAEERLAGREAELKRAADSHEAEQARAAAAHARLGEACGELNTRLQAVGIKPVAPDPRALEALPARLELRKQDVERALDLAAAVADAEAQLRAVADPLAQAAQRRDEMGTAAANAQQLLEAAVEALDADLHDWRLSLTELRIADEALESIAATLVADGNVRALLADCAAPRTAELRTERADADARRTALGVALRDARERAAEIEAQRTPEPAPRSARRGSRAGRAGAPLWAACDFRDHVADDDRAALEAALEDAGLLDAWITPDGTIHDADVTLLALEDGPSGAQHGTLADLLAPDRADPRVEEAIVAAVLRSIPLQGPLSVAPGRFRFGALHGRARKPAPEYIGASARAALRARLLQEARAAVTDLESQAALLTSEVDRIAEAQARLDDEQRRLPPVDALRSAQAAERRTGERLAVAEEQLAALVSQRDRYDQTVAISRDALALHAGAANLPTEPVLLRSAAQAIEQAGGGIEAVVRALEGVDAATQRLSESAQRFEEMGAAMSKAREDDARAAEDLATAEGRLAAAQTADGASVAELRAPGRPRCASSANSSNAPGGKPTRTVAAGSRHARTPSARQLTRRPQ